MQTIGTPFLWVTFSVAVLALLIIDLALMAKSGDKEMTKRAALLWTTMWVSLAAAFGVGIWFLAPEARAREAALEFAAAYLIEYSLSVDNLFVFLLLFSSFKVPREYQHRVLFWGIFGAVVLRAIFIFVGTALLQQFHWLIYVFGVFLIYTGAKLIFGGEEDEGDVSDNRIVKLAKRFMRVSDHYDGHNFFTVQNGVRVATPLFLVLVSVELSDVVFALDSIPAVFGVSTDPFIVYTSNIFAILGLRSLFFLLAGALWGLRFLKPALGMVLGFVGIKMCLGLVHAAAEALGHPEWVSFVPHHLPTPVSLGVIAGLLVIGVALSLLFPGKKPDDIAAANEIKDDVREVIHPHDKPKH